jgi:hypothetical protein
VIQADTQTQANYAQFDQTRKTEQQELILATFKADAGVQAWLSAGASLDEASIKVSHSANATKTSKA